MRQAVSKSSTVNEFDATEFLEMDEGDFEYLREFGHLVQSFTLEGNDLWLWPFTQSITDIFCPLTNITKFSLSRSDLPPTLRFLRLLPATLSDLTLDNLSFPAQEFITYLPQLGHRLDKLTLTKVNQLTHYDLVTILQHFWRLDTLNIKQTDYITAGTASTILRYCYNLQTFLFSPMFKFRQGRAWIDIVELDYSHVEYDEALYDQVNVYNMFLIDGLMDLTDSSDDE